MAWRTRLPSLDGLVPSDSHFKEGAEETREPFSRENGEGVFLEEGQMVRGGYIAQDARPRIGKAVGF